MDELTRREAITTLLAAGAAAIGGRAEVLAALDAAPATAQLAVIQSPDIRAATRAAVAAIGGMSRFVSRGAVVFVKPNIGWARTPAQGANTHPDVVASVVEQCLEAGAKVVKVVDHTIDDPDRCYRRSGIQAAAEAAGAQVEHVEATRFRRMDLKGRALGEWEVYPDIVEADVVINVPVVKHHSLCRMTVGMKNWLGMLGGRRADLHPRIDDVAVDCTAFFRPALTVVDASRVMIRNGPQGGSLTDVKQTDTVGATADPIAGDALGAELLAVPVADVAYLALGRERGLGTDDLSSIRVERRRL